MDSSPFIKLELYFQTIVFQQKSGQGPVLVPAKPGELPGVPQADIFTGRSPALQFVPSPGGGGGPGYPEGNKVAESCAAVPLGNVLVQEAVSLLDGHPQAGRLLGFPVDFRVNIAQIVGVIQAAPAGVGAGNRHAGAGDRRHQLRPILVHLRVQLRGGHGEARVRLGFQVAHPDEEAFQVQGVGVGGFRGWDPSARPPGDEVVVYLPLRLVA